MLMLREKCCIMLIMEHIIQDILPCTCQPFKTQEACFTSCLILLREHHELEDAGFVDSPHSCRGQSSSQNRNNQLPPNRTWSPFSCFPKGCFSAALGSSTGPHLLSSLGACLRSINPPRNMDDALNYKGG